MCRNVYEKDMSCEIKGLQNKSIVDRKSIMDRTVNENNLLLYEVQKCHS